MYTKPQQNLDLHNKRLDYCEKIVRKKKECAGNKINKIVLEHVLKK